MKFSNGCWLQKEGTAVFSPQEVYYCEISDALVKLVAPTHHIGHRGDTLGGVNLTLEISAPMEGVLRVKTYHHKGAVKDAPSFELSFSGNHLKTEDDTDRLIVRSGELSLHIDKKNWSMEYRRGGMLLAKSDNRDLAYVRTDWRGDAYVTSSGTDMYLRQQLSIDVDETFYGFGERFTPFVKNGQTVEIWNEDGGTSTEQSYKNIPFYISSKGYGVFINHTDRVSFEVGSEIVNKVSMTVPGEELDHFFIDGPDMKAVISRYTALCGRPALPPVWSFGLWLSTSFTTNYDEATVMSFIDGMKERDIPLSVFHFDCFWMKEFHWTDLAWDERVFPDPKGMLMRIHEKGLRICVWINPYIAQESLLFDEGAEKGYFLKRPDGGVWQWDMWQPGMAIVDFTNPFAYEWFKDKLRVLIEMGVDCFKTDFGERIPTDCVYANGLHPRKMHNYYTYLYNKAVFEVLLEMRGETEACLFARSATCGGQKYPVHWGGDCWSDYSGMSESLRGGLSLMLSGFGFWSHDMGGFESKSTPDVYKRWAAFGLLSSHSRLHGSTSYRVPWMYDEEAVDVVRHFTKMKLKLMPYLYAAAIRAHEEGIPVMRPMVMEYPEDKTCRYLDKQYFFGESLLVAPIFNANGIGEFYLPEGRWTEFFTGEVTEGGHWLKKEYDYFTLPMYVRENTILAIGEKDDTPSYDHARDVSLLIYEITDQAEAKIYGSDGCLEASVTAKRTEDGLHLTLHTSKPCTIVLKNLVASGVSGASLRTDGRDSVLKDPSETIVCRF